MASSFSSAQSRRPTFFGPYHHLLGVRASGWDHRFEECMLASASALELEKVLEEDLGIVSASVGDLIAEDSEAMAVKSWVSGPSSVIDETVAEMLKESYFPTTRVKIRLPGRTVPVPEEGYVVVFQDFFASASPTSPSSAACWRRLTSSSII